VTAAAADLGASAASEGLAHGYTERRAWYLVAALTSCAIISQVDRMAMTLLVTPLQRDLGLSDTDIGLIGGLAFAIFYAAAGLPLASLADRYSRRLIILVSLVAWSIMTAMCGFAVGYWSLFAARILVAIGEASNAPAGNSLLASVFPASRLSKPLSVFALGGSLGNTVAAVLVAGFVALAPYVSPHLSYRGEPLAPWRVAFIGLAIAGLVPFVLMLFTREPARLTRREDAVPMGEFLRYILARWRGYAPCYFGYALLVVPLVAVSFWAPTAYERAHGVSATTAGAWLGVGYVVGGMTGTLFGGWLADRWTANGLTDGKLRTLAVAVGGMAPSTLVSQVVPQFALGVGVLWIAMFFAGMGLGPVTAALQGMTPARLRARAAALLYLFINVIAFGGVPAASLINAAIFGRPDTLNYALALLAVAFGGLALAVLLWGMPHYRRLLSDQAARG
jgi:MFS family permease